MIVAYAAATLLGFAGMIVASERAVQSASALVAGTTLPPFFVGITLLAVGTDLPEIANSIAASVSGHGDVNVAASVGSAATQSTLILGLLPIVAGAMTIPRRSIPVTGVCTVVGLVLVIALTADDRLGRTDAIVLIWAWIVGSWIIYKAGAGAHQLTLPEEPEPRGPLVARTLAALAVVAVSATVSLWGIVGIADRLDVPEFLVAFFLASVGTSLPELVFDLTALRAGATALAVGDIVGSSFVDSSLAIGVGPLIAPTAVTSDEIVPAAVASLVAIAAVTVILGRIRTHDWRTGALLISFYAAFFFVLL